MQWYLTVWKKYAVFEGRSRRQEYWMFVLINLIIGIIFGIIEYFISGFVVIQYLYELAILIPGLAVTARRLHDTNRSGWWQLIGLIPLVGWIILLVFLCQDSDVDSNRFGSNPK
ncbi:uncharacterized membrane protein YhaH (DUF805 family) [Pullulanibacillus pueri]|uniref:DUF805 domain-containing protein n=1 Tax=Pullulanibacillus pueri TaxID=1437324 RepID=A0A8J2ZV57_9BACL|nr:DUF805 domain-containing protein [Pullulanibacillus pueri]MBM7682112.1 uncharacterized membrane protein YhaH (DUF805 family) [Pullulanibacillus pueri]GGH79933.1 DUF805 domain-containing protein [Pullulanibacillus pueri]